jgi:phage tail sheath protein FI
MSDYFAPGVYVEEIPSAVKPIAGVSTSIACFIGVVPDKIQIPQQNPQYDPTRKPAPPAAVKPVKDDQAAKPDDNAGGVPARPAQYAPDNLPYKLVTVDVPTPAGEVRLCTSFSDFQRQFASGELGAFSTDTGQNQLAHAINGYFGNGGSVCYVIRIKSSDAIDDALQASQPYEDISTICVPGNSEDTVRAAVTQHCEVTMPDRFAVFDGPQKLDFTNAANTLPKTTKNGAYYQPWLKVFDLATKLQDPKGKGIISTPPSGHMAGIFARVDTQRGVHKAPANEVVLGALDLEYLISKPQQTLLNPPGINCIRNMNGNVTVWGARTVGGERNQDWKYLNVRRTFQYLVKSIDRGTQWVVFEPNDQKLWAKIIRNITAFLTVVWRNGALFGADETQAFYVKCDEELNPAATRDLGQVICEIGVAISRPAEFVIFRISQWQPPTK